MPDALVDMLEREEHDMSRCPRRYADTAEPIRRSLPRQPSCLFDFGKQAITKRTERSGGQIPGRQRRQR